MTIRINSSPDTGHWQATPGGPATFPATGEGGRRTTSRRVFLVSLGSLVLTDTGAKGAKADKQAQASIARLVAALDKLSAQGRLSEPQLMARFDRLAVRYLNIQIMARDALGSGAIPKTLWADFINAYRRHLQAGFVEGVRRYGASQSKVLGSRTAPNGLPVVITRSKIGGRSRDTVWFMCRNDTARVCDVEVNGVRASARQRSAFMPVLTREGPRDFIKRLAAGQFATDGSLQP